MSYIGKIPATGNFVKLDAISVVNGQAAYTMQSGSVNFTPESANHMLVSLNGVIQAPGTSFTVSGSTITFASALSTGDVINFIMVYGNVLDIGTPSDDTISASKLQTDSVIEAKIQNDAVTRDKINAISTSSLPSFEAKGTSGQTDGYIQLNCEQNSHGIKLKSPPHSAGQSYTLTFPSTAPATDKFLKTDNSGNLSFADAGGGKILQVVSGTDNTKYAITTNSQTTDYAGSTAFSITPSSTNSKIMIHFFVGQVMSENGSGIRFRIYRQIGGSGGFTNVTALGGADDNNKRGSVAGNFGSHTDSEDQNRSRTLAGTLVDSPNTTSAVEYKLYYGSGDTGNRNIYVNRTRGDSNDYYTSQTITHVTLLEVGA